MREHRTARELEPGLAVLRPRVPRHEKPHHREQLREGFGEAVDRVGGHAVRAGHHGVDLQDLGDAARVVEPGGVLVAELHEGPFAHRRFGFHADQRDPRPGAVGQHEIQKIPGWSETVKRLWDEDTRAKRPLQVVLLGSAPLLIAQGLTESLAGRFEVIFLPHWSYAEMRAAFGWSLEKFVFYGGYPGAAVTVHEVKNTLLI